MSLDLLLLIILIFFIYLACSVFILEFALQKEIFIDSFSWFGTLIALGDEIAVHTSDGITKGFFRGLIYGQKQILRLSCEGQPKMEFPWQKIIDITKLS